MLQQNWWPISHWPSWLSHWNSLHVENITILCCHLKCINHTRNHQYMLLNLTNFTVIETEAGRNMNYQVFFTSIALILHHRWANTIITTGGYFQSRSDCWSELSSSCSTNRIARKENDDNDHWEWSLGHALVSSSSPSFILSMTLFIHGWTENQITTEMSIHMSFKSHPLFQQIL